MLGTGGNKDRMAFTQINLLAFDVKRSSALKDDVDLVVDVGSLLSVVGRAQSSSSPIAWSVASVIPLRPTRSASAPVAGVASLLDPHGQAEHIVGPTVLMP